LLVDLILSGPHMKRNPVTDSEDGRGLVGQRGLFNECKLTRLLLNHVLPLQKLNARSSTIYPDHDGSYTLKMIIVWKCLRISLPFAKMKTTWKKFKNTILVDHWADNFNESEALYLNCHPTGTRLLLDDDFSSPSAVVDKYLKKYLLACILLNVTISATSPTLNIFTPHILFART
jgi:hypothetical protein